jgi:acyl-CoA thioesterase II
MGVVESAWTRYPDYRIELVAWRGRAVVRVGDVVLAETDRAVLLYEQDHVDRLYVPEEDVRWEHFTATDHHTACPFKGEADYWNLTAVDPPLEHVLWAYRAPFEQVAGIAGHVCFYENRVDVTLEDPWPGERPGSVVRNRFPVWGDAADLLALLDVAPAGPGRFSSPPYRERSRNVVEGGHQLAQAIVAASKTVPEQRVVNASMIFSKAAAFDAPLDLSVEVLRRGRSFSTVEVRVHQGGAFRSVGTLLLDAGAPDLMRGSVPMPDVAGPEDAVPYDMRVTGRELRIVDAAYSPDPELVGPPEIHAWMRFRDAPAEPYLHTALLAQATTHWTIAAAMRPHRGIGERDAHVSLSTGIMAVSLALHDDVDVTDWFLYSNPAVHAGRGLAQGEGRVFARDGRLLATYTVGAIVRSFPEDPDGRHRDAATAM